MDLPGLIEEAGVAQVAQACGVSRRAVRAWRLGYRRPLPESAKRIVAAFPGMTTFAEIYASAGRRVRQSRAA